MVIKYIPEFQQDTTATRINIVDSSDVRGHEADSSIYGNITHDSLALSKAEMDTASPVISRKILKATLKREQDTTSVCIRNPVADVTFFNPDHVVRSVRQDVNLDFPYRFTEKNRDISARKREIIIKHLKNGETKPDRIYNKDWITVILMLSVLFFVLVRSFSKSTLPGFGRFYLFRGTGEEGTRDLMGIFQWQTTVLNLAAFFSNSVFLYFVAAYHNIILQGMPDYILWLIILGVMIAAVTIRHFICLITGFMSNQESIFRDYLHTVYQSYRLSGLLLFFIAVMMAYTGIIPDKTYIFSGVVIISLHYLIRISRLFKIYINRNISIFYLILYLCALEILPVLIIIRFFSGLR